MRMVKAAIVGSRSFNDYEAMLRFLGEITHREGFRIQTIISGGASGADALAERAAREFNKELVVFPADWKRYGRRAGIIRNEDIIKACEVCFAFWDGQSKGTANDIELCKRYGKPCYICYFK